MIFYGCGSYKNFLPLGFFWEYFYTAIVVNMFFCVRNIVAICSYIIIILFCVAYTVLFYENRPDPPRFAKKWRISGEFLVFCNF